MFDEVQHHMLECLYCRIMNKCLEEHRSILQKLDLV